MPPTARDTCRLLAHQHHDQRPGWDGPGQREHVQEFARREPVVHLDGLPLHVRQDGRAAAERQQRQRGEHDRDLEQCRHHRPRSNSVRPRLAGSITISTSSSGMRRMPIPTMIAAATSTGPTRRM